MLPRASAWSAALLEAQTLGQGPGGRRRDGRRRGARSWRASSACTRPASGTDERGANLLDTRRAVLRRLRDARRQVRRDRLASSRSSTPRCCEQLGLDAADAAAPERPQRVARRCKQRFAAVFKTKTRDEWCGAHGRHRRLLRAGALARRRRRRIRTRRRASAFVDVGRRHAARARAALQPHAPAVQSPAPARGEHTDQVLEEYGVGAAEINDLRGASVIA